MSAYHMTIHIIVWLFFWFLVYCWIVVFLLFQSGEKFGSDFCENQFWQVQHDDAQNNVEF